MHFAVTPHKHHACKVGDFLHPEGQRALRVELHFAPEDPLLALRNKQVVAEMQKRFDRKDAIHVMVIDGSNMNTAKAVRKAFPRAVITGVNNDASTVMAMLHYQSTPRKKLYDDAVWAHLGRRVQHVKAPLRQVADLEAEFQRRFDVILFDACGTLKKKELTFPEGAGDAKKPRLLLVTVCKRGNDLSGSVDDFVPKGYVRVVSTAVCAKNMSSNIFESVVRHHPRPRGKSPKGKVWDFCIGQWAAEAKTAEAMTTGAEMKTKRTASKRAAAKRAKAAWTLEVPSAITPSAITPSAITPSAASSLPEDALSNGISALERELRKIKALQQEGLLTQDGFQHVSNALAATWRM